MKLLFVFIFSFSTLSPFAHADTFQPLYHCGSARLENVSSDHYASYKQLIVSGSAVESLRSQGAINDSDLNSNGELVLKPLQFQNWTATYYAFSARNGGQLIYKIQPAAEFNADPNKRTSLSIEIEWSNQGLSQHGEFSKFASYYWHGCGLN